ncbi:hypothetical protein [Microbacterium sp. P01]|uniref:hypothetical protein n=1 Tax=unclassified Microbacterium TaxID=2609290 RepID=UPI00366A6600
MSRFAIDAPTALRLLEDGRQVAADHSLVAPSLLRSHVLSLLYRASRAGQQEESETRKALEGLAELKIRLLGDRVSRATAFRLAADLGWDDTPLAEYLAVASLQADALVTDDPSLREGARGLVPLADFGDLFA